MDGFDFLGAITLSPSKTKAVASGNRAIAAAQKIAKTAPRLSATITKAGQKALATAGTGVSQPTTASSTTKTSQPDSQSTGSSKTTSTSPDAKGKSAQYSQKTDKDHKAQERIRAANQAYFHPKSATKVQPKKGRTHIGDEASDAEGTDQQADIYSQLADAASMVAEFIGQMQEIQKILPQNLPIAKEGLEKINGLQSWFIDPIEKALSGDSKMTGQWTQSVSDLANTFIVDEKADPPDRSIWAWVNKANAYFKLHPELVPNTQQSTTQPTDTAIAQPTTTTVPATTMPPSSTVPSQMPATSAPMAAPSASPSMGMPPQQSAPDDGGGGYYEEDSGGSYEEEGDEYPSDEEDPGYEESEEEGDYEDNTEVGRGGGRGGHGHHHGGGRRGRGGIGPYWGGPWGGWPVYEGIEIDDQLTQSDVDDITDDVAKKVVSHLKKTDKATVGEEGFDLLGDEQIGVDLLDWRTPSDYRNAVNQLKVSADNLNLTAALLPAWKSIYENALALHAKYKDAGWLNFMSLSDATWYAIADAQKRVDEFAAQMRARGEPVYEPSHVPPEQSGLTGGAAEWAKKNWPWLLGGGIAIVAIPTVLPPLIGMAALSRK